MDNFIKLIEPYISFNEVSGEIQDIFNSGRFTQGKNVEKFVKSLKAYTKSNYVGLTTSATTALSLSLRVLGVRPGNLVGVADYSWPASSNVIEEIGAIPEFIDIDPLTFNMSLSDLEKKIDNGLSAVIFVDTFGNPSDLEDIKKICSSKNIPLLEDGACALGSEINGEKIGSISDITCFSFHPRKLLNTGEGGAIMTNKKDIQDILKIKLSAGSSGKKDVGLEFSDYGFNYRLTEIQSLMGWKQLDNIDQIISERNIIKDFYIEHLKEIGFIPQKINQNIKHNVQSVVFRVPESVKRNDLVKFLYENKIESTLGTYSLSATSYNKKKYNKVQKNSQKLESEAITLPCYRGLDPEPIIKKIKDFSKISSKN